MTIEEPEAKQVGAVRDCPFCEADVAEGVCDFGHAVGPAVEPTGEAMIKAGGIFLGEAERQRLQERVKELERENAAHVRVVRRIMKAVNEGWTSEKIERLRVALQAEREEKP